MSGWGGTDEFDALARVVREEAAASMVERLVPLDRTTERVPQESDAWCDRCGHLGGQLSPRAAGQMARDHARQTGHTTWARHIQMVTYDRSYG
jgi:hypothetical protein